MRGRRIGHILLLLYAAIFLVHTPVLAEQLVIPGSGSCEVILSELAAAFDAANPGSEIIIPESIGSVGAVNLVASGETVLGRVGRPLLDSEKSRDLEYLPFAKDMIVFVVGQRVGVQNLSGQQLADIFSGKVENWELVGGSNAQVRLLFSEPDDSSLVTLRQKMETFKDITFAGRAKMLFHDHEIVKALNKYTTAIGWLTNSSLKSVYADVHVISVDGITPTRENVLDGKYDIIGEYALIYKKNKLVGLAKRFVDFVFSEQGNRIMVDMGLVPVNKQNY